VGLSSQITKIVISIGIAEIDRALFQRLTWLVVVLAGIGVFATLLTQARERVRDLGIHKALGMTPWQVITMISGWAVAPALIAAAIALPAGTALEPVVARAIVSAQAGSAQNLGPLIHPSPGRAGGDARLSRQHHRTAAGGTVRYTRHGKALINAPPGRPPGSGPRPGAPPFSGLRSIAGQSPYTPGGLALLVLAGLAIALAGALGPAIWAAASRTTTALSAE
jgi:ABC-type antimicrobial peptide transport system permease subunit